MILKNQKIVKNFPILRFLFILTVVLSLSACMMMRHSVAITDKTALPEAQRQVLLVADDSILFLTRTTIHALEKTDSIWRQAMEPMDAVIGRNGFAPPGEKREGDGRTPSGLYMLGTAFGYAESAVTKMPYRQVVANDLWVDDPNAPDYNRWVKQGETSAASYEKMKRDDNLYKYGIVIEYNTAPVIKNYGSAIFMHVWKGPGSTTAGCVAVSEENILKILSWLNPAANPVILINPDP